MTLYLSAGNFYISRVIISFFWAVTVPSPPPNGPGTRRSRSF